ncbi:hypothetical protein M3Y97_01071800 [Aphelenchoides bicaudatus]|nr:hypothetical protein M3Y97_01071800 [Aphelenchoides bicaudatus]
MCCDISFCVLGYVVINIGIHLHCLCIDTVCVALQSSTSLQLNKFKEQQFKGVAIVKRLQKKDGSVLLRHQNLSTPLQLQLLRRGTSIPIEKRKNIFLGSVVLCCYVVFFSLYSLVVYAMLRSQYRNQETYRLMIFLGILHCLGLQSCGLATGFFAINGDEFCSRPTMMYLAGQLALCKFFKSNIKKAFTSNYFLGTWCSSAMTSLLLGFNRCCELYGGGLGQRLFGGYRFWLWVSIPFGYLWYIFWFTPTVVFSSVQMAWLFDPHADYYPDLGKTYHNKVHSMNNIILCSTESFLSTSKVLCVGIIHFTASSIYVFIQFVHVDFVISMIASTFYLLSQVDKYIKTVLKVDVKGFPSVIYLCVNRTVRNLVLSTLGLRKRTLAAVLPNEPKASNTATNTSNTLPPLSPRV